MIERIISGGQTGADRAALDAAIACGVPHGGWCPAGRRSEDGSIPDRYQLQETFSHSYLPRTERNVEISHGTVILTLGELRGGSARTMDFCLIHGLPWLHLRLDCQDTTAAAQALTAFIREHRVTTLNVAGSRESGEPGIYQRVHPIITACLQPHPSPI